MRSATSVDSGFLQNVHVSVLWTSTTQSLASFIPFVTICIPCVCTDCRVECHIGTAVGNLAGRDPSDG